MDFNIDNYNVRSTSRNISDFAPQNETKYATADSQLDSVLIIEQRDDEKLNTTSQATRYQTLV